MKVRASIRLLTWVMMMHLLARHVNKISPESIASKQRSRGDKVLAYKMYSVAFRAYMQAESMLDLPNYARLCQMAMNGQLNKAEFQELDKVLQDECLRNNPRATLHYGLLCSHSGNHNRAIAVYERAILLGVNEARELLNQAIIL